MNSKSRNIVRVIVEMLFLILSTKLTINGESAFRTYQNKEAGRFVWSYLKRSYILTFLRSYTPHYKQESAENFLAMVTRTNFIYKLSRFSHLVRHSKYSRLSLNGHLSKTDT